MIQVKIPQVVTIEAPTAGTLNIVPGSYEDNYNGRNEITLRQNGFILRPCNVMWIKGQYNEALPYAKLDKTRTMRSSGAAIAVRPVPMIHLSKGWVDAGISATVGNDGDGEVVIMLRNDNSQHSVRIIEGTVLGTLEFIEQL